MYKGTIIENSLNDAGILSRLQIDHTWKSGDWTLYDVRITKDQISQIGTYLADGPWYVHFWESGKDDVVVVFKDKTFAIQFSDKSTWQDALEYGRSLGVPEEQLDFPIN